MSLPRIRSSTYDRLLVVLLLIIIVVLSVRLRSVANLNQQLLPEAQGIHALTRMVQRYERVLGIWEHPFLAQSLPCVFPDRQSASLEEPPDHYRLLLVVALSDARRILDEISFWNELVQLEASRVEVVAVVACREEHECRRFALSQTLRMPVFHDEKGSYLRTLNADSPNETPIRILVDREGTVLHVSDHVLDDGASQTEYMKVIRRIVS